MTMMVMGTVPDEANGGDEDDWEKENAEQDGDEDVGEGGLQVHQQVIDHQHHKPSSFDRSWPAGLRQSCVIITNIIKNHHHLRALTLRHIVSTSENPQPILLLLKQKGHLTTSSQRT